MTILAACNGEKRYEQVTSTWLAEADIPANVVDGSQPAQGSDGVRHKVLSCKQVENDLVYEAQFDNPYNHALNAIVAASLDGGTDGSIWGFFAVTLPPGPVRALVNTGNIPEHERDRLLYQTLPIINHPVDECSIHLVGFVEGSEFLVASPVAYAKFGSDSFLPSKGETQ